MSKTNKINRPARKFLPEDFQVQNWEGMKPYFDQLLARDLSSVAELRRWCQNRSELESVISEDLAWRYIKMTCFTENQEYVKAYQQFVQEIQPEIAPYHDLLNKKAVASPSLQELSKEIGYDLMIKNILKEIEIFREENIPLQTEIATASQTYGQISGAMTIEHEGKTLTLPQASVYLMNPDRALREKVYHQVVNRRLQDQEQLDALFNQLVKLRNKVALNANFANFRDYMFKALGRFDYGTADCRAFHQSVAKQVVPILKELAEERQAKLGLSSLKPWDKAVDTSGKPALHAFSSGKELADKGITLFKKLDSFLGECLEIMQNMGHFDLESRPGKAPGGYNYPLSEIGVPFIFMNATSTLRDMVTFMHEGGHAVHSFLTKDLELQDFKSTPSEVAELASMSMELISMEHWNLFFENPDDLRRAKREHLEGIIETLPWVATVDKFQHWIYENPEHTAEDRRNYWDSLINEFGDAVSDWSGLEKARQYLWQKQLHLYEVPFYYIEYGMAQLGAVAVWRNYKQNPEAGLKAYQAALKLGHLKSIPEVYQAAGIKFDFSESYIKELMDFLKQELASLS